LVHATGNATAKPVAAVPEAYRFRQGQDPLLDRFPVLPSHAPRNLTASMQAKKTGVTRESRPRLAFLVVSLTYWAAGAACGAAGATGAP